MSFDEEWGMYLFVYGTLRRNTHNKMHHYLAQQADFIDYANYQGKLYQIDNYPGVIASNSPNDSVQGEVYRLKDSISTLDYLDKYEECSIDFPLPTEYVRKIQSVRLARGQNIQAWVYLYNRPTDGLIPIESGDFIKA